MKKKEMEDRIRRLESRILTLESLVYRKQWYKQTNTLDAIDDSQQ